MSKNAVNLSLRPEVKEFLAMEVRNRVDTGELHKRDGLPFIKKLQRQGSLTPLSISELALYNTIMGDTIMDIGRFEPLSYAGRGHYVSGELAEALEPYQYRKSSWSGVFDEEEDCY